MSKELKAISVLKTSLTSHRVWIEYIQEHPDFTGETHGDIKFHQALVDDYNDAIKDIEQLQSELAEVKKDKKRQAENLDAEIYRLQEQIDKEMPFLQLKNVELQAELDKANKQIEVLEKNGKRHALQ